MLRISVAPSGSTAIVKMSGSVEASDATTTFTFMKEIVLEKFNDVLVDLSECADMDSTLMGTLLVMHERHKRKKGKFCLINVGLDNKRALRLLGVPKVVPLRQMKLEKTPKFVPVDLRDFRGKPKDRIKVLQVAHQALVHADQENAKRFGSFLSLLEAELAC